MRKLSKLPLALALIGCSGFATALAVTVRHSTATFGNLEQLSLILAEASYKRGCLESSPAAKRNLCDLKAKQHQEYLQDLYNRVGHLPEVK